MKRYLITGGLGFIGKNLTNKLSEKNKVLIVDDKSNGNLKNLKKNKNIKIKISKIQNLKKLNNIKGIFHLSAQSSAQKSLNEIEQSSLNNLISSIKVFEVAKNNNCPIIFASSSAVYGNLKIGNDKIDNIDLLSPYALDKYYLEKLSQLFFKLYKVSSIGMRLYNVYGLGQKENSKYSGVIPKIKLNLKKNKKTFIYGGDQTRDFIHVNDVVKLSISFMKLVEKKNINEIFNVGTGRQISIINLYKKMKKISKKKNKFVIKKIRIGDPKISKGSFEKLKKILSKNFNFVSLDEGLKEII